MLGPVASRPRIRSTESVAAATARLRAALPGPPPPVIFVVGCGEGAMVDAIAAVAPSTEVLVFEPDPAAAALFLEMRDWTPALNAGRLALFVGRDYQGASGFWRPVTVPNGEIVTLVDPALAEKGPDETAHAIQLIDRLIEEARANADARRAHASRYLLQTLANTAVIAREGDVSTLTGLFANYPALIVGAGPSLDGHLDEIAAVAERCIVIACAAAARPLIAAGIAPQFIVSVDPTEINATHVLGLQTRTSWLVGEGSLHPTTFAAFDRHSFVFNVSDHHPWPWLRTIGISRGRLSTWGSVSTSAVDLALKLGCGPILLAGLDFAFTGGRSHCRGTTFEPQWAVRMAEGLTFDQLCHQQMNRWPLTLEADLDGHLVRTTPHFVSFRNWMRQQVEAASDTRFMHVTPGGILHHRFIEHCSCEEAVGAAAPIDAKAADTLIRDRHRLTAVQSDALFPGIAAVLDGSSESVAHVSDWSRFTGGSLRREHFMAALRSHDVQAWLLGRGVTVPA